MLAAQIAFLAVTARGGPQTRATIAAGSIAIPAFLGLICLSYFEHRHAIRTSSLLVLYLLGTIPMDALRARTLLQMHDGRGSAITVIVLAISKLYTLANELTWKRSLAVQHQLCEMPEETNGIVERALMFRMFPIFRTGYKTPLGVQHLFKIDPILYFGRLGSWVASGKSWIII